MNVMYYIVENFSKIEEKQVLEYGISNGEVTVEGISPERPEVEELVSCLNEYGAEFGHKPHLKDPMRAGCLNLGWHRSTGSR